MKNRTDGKNTTPYALKSGHPNLKTFVGDECLDAVNKDNTEVSYKYTQSERVGSGNISHDFLEWLADNFTVPLSHNKDGVENPKPYPQKSLRKNDGEVDVDLALYCMGFQYDWKRKQTKYTILSSNQRKGVVRKVESLENKEKESLTTGVYVRDNNNPYRVREQIVYSGKIRPESYARNLYDKFEVLTGDFVHGVGDIRDITSIGTIQWYERRDIKSQENRVLAEESHVCEE